MFSVIFKSKITFTKLLTNFIMVLGNKYLNICIFSNIWQWIVQDISKEMNFFKALELANLSLIVIIKCLTKEFNASSECDKLVPKESWNC